jgi:hypothetical protein
MMKMQEDGCTVVPTALPAATVARTSAKAVVTAVNCKSYQSAYHSRIAKAYLLAFIVVDGRFCVSENVASVLLVG